MENVTDFSQKAEDSRLTSSDLEDSILRHFDQIRELKRRGGERSLADNIESRDDNRSRYNRFTDRLRFDTLENTSFCICYFLVIDYVQ